MISQREEQRRVTFMKSGLKFIRRDKEKFIMGEALLLSTPIITAFVVKFVKSLITRACR